MSIGDRIIELRKGFNMSQQDLAKAMDVSRQAVSKWETDQSTPDAANLIRLSEILDTDIEYLSTGRRTLGIRPPVVIKTTETVEKIVEKPIIKLVEKVVEKVVEVPVVQVLEKPVLKKVYRTKYVSKPLELILVGTVCFLLGFILGLLL